MWMDEPFGMFSVMDTLFPILFFGVFAVVILTFVVALVRGAGQWRRNNAAPVLTVEAEVVAKRTQVSRGARAHGDMTDMTGGFTRYYATFEVESGSRIELAVRGEEYGMLAEGDRGRLTFQGTRSQGFERA